jgi:hypothetical protein
MPIQITTCKCGRHHSANLKACPGCRTPVPKYGPKETKPSRVEIMRKTERQVATNTAKINHHKAKQDSFKREFCQSTMNRKESE